MKTIWKYPIGNGTSWDIPDGSEFLSLNIQDGICCLWFLVDESRNKSTKKFRIIGTGYEVQYGLKYLGTYQDSPFVWHVFEDLG